MADFQHSDAIARVVKSALSGDVGDHILDYLTSMLQDSLEEGVVEGLSNISDLLSEYLVSYSLAKDSAEALSICEAIYRGLQTEGLLSVFLSETAKKRSRVKKGSKIMAMYYEDGGWYEAVVDELVGENFYVTFTEYGNQEELTLDDIELLEKEENKNALEEVAQLGAQEEEDAIQTRMNEVIYKRDRCLTDYVQKDLREMADPNLLTNKQKKAHRKKMDRLAKFDPKNYKKILKQSMQEEWFDVSLKSRTKTVNIQNYDLYALDEVTCLARGMEINLVEGRHYGLIGRNGCGKTTFLRRISRYDIEEFPKYIRVMHIEQEIIGDDKTVLETVLGMDVVLTTLNEREAQCEIDQNNGDETAGVRLAKVFEMRRDLELGDDIVRARAKEVMRGLMFTEEMFDWPTSRLSGGWRMRVSLAGALFVSPDILMLDEPTNHLDFPSVVWLENYLKSYQNTLLIVSHDREFLNNVSNTTIYMNEGELEYFKGNFAQFTKTREDAYLNQLKEYNAQQMQIAHIQAFIDRWRANAKKASMVQSRIKTLKAMTFIKEPQIDRGVTMEIPQTAEFEDTVSTSVNVMFGYDVNKLLFKKVNFQLTMQSRIGVIGANGAGKSTLVKLVLKHLEPLFGRITTNRSCRIVPFFQHHIDQLDLRETSMDFIFNKFRAQLLLEQRPDEIIRNRLGNFGLSADLVDRPIGTLSGGQKSRVAFTILTWNTPNFIVMDEPTNHLDMETSDALIGALNKWKGGLMIVSHDQHFLQSVAKEYWVVANQDIQVLHEFGEAKEVALKHHKIHTL